MALIERLKTGLSKTRSGLYERLKGTLLGRRIDEEALLEVEEILVTSDMGVEVATEVVSSLRGAISRGQVKDYNSLMEELRRQLLKILGLPQPFAVYQERPFVVLMVGVNGVGKTTTIGKLGWKLHNEGYSVVFAASDTFRAAAIEQLEIWAEKAGVQIVRQQSGADPAAVAYDAITSAKAKNYDVVIIDTAGRLHTKFPLMEELKKIKRVIGKASPGAPQEVLLVVDATTGQNALRQARFFHDAIGITGIALTKMDGTAKGGIVFAIKKELDIPVRFIGVGEGIDDLQDFVPEAFVEAILPSGD